MLDNPTYAGLRRHRGKLYRGNWKPIIAPETWQRAQALRRLARPSPGTNTAAVESSVYFLTGMLNCGVCGRKLYHRTRQDRVPGVYLCRGDPKIDRCDGGGIADHRAEEMVVNAFLTRFGKGAVERVGPSDRKPPALVGNWEDFSFEEKRELLATAIERIELIPRPQGNTRGKGQPRGRRLSIRWAGTPAATESGVAPTLAVYTPVGKACDDCGRRKPLKEFRQDASQDDGRSNRCGRCHTLREVNSLLQGPLRGPDSGPQDEPDPRAPWHEYHRALARRRRN
jgi:hypothetical protein